MDSFEGDCIPSAIDSFPSRVFVEEPWSPVLHVSIFVYASGMIALVCEQHFVPALEIITHKLRLSPDVAGATFMAMGASAPEFFSSVAGSFITKDDIGLGTILGSALFNILCISGVAGIVLWKKALPIEWYPVLRDCIVYGFTVIALSLIIADNFVQWWEALVLLGIFSLYILLMRFNGVVKSGVESLPCCLREDLEKAPLLEPKQEGLHSSTAERLWRVVMWLPIQLFRFTVPPPSRFYPLTFGMSIVWMGLLSYVAVWMVTIIGYTLRVPDSVSGLTLLAAGSSIPDLVATVIIAKIGEGNMAISNLLGSNIFDLAFCLGAPWFVKSLLSKNGRMLVYSSALIYTTATLLVTLSMLLITFQCTGWRLSRNVGFVCLTLYFISITLSCLYELNVFAVLNKPTCF